MTGADVDPLRPASLGKLYVVGMIADNKRAPQVNAMLLGRSVQEMGIGFDAMAAVAAVMGTDVRGGDLQPRLGQRRHHMGIDPLHLFQGQNPLAHAGLVGHDEEQEVFAKPARASTAPGRKWTSGGSARYPRSSIRVPSRSRKTAYRFGSLLMT